MQILKYNLIAHSETGAEIMGAAVELTGCEANLEIARKEAWQGIVTTEEVPDEAAPAAPTTEQRLAALETAMLAMLEV